MYKIKFSHRYLKMPKTFENTSLIDVWVKNIADISPSFLAYDTTYEGGRYPLPKTGVFMILLLCTHTTLWTTIRSWSPDKEEFYRSLIGKEVGVTING
jgi:hypothetical protein